MGRRSISVTVQGWRGSPLWRSTETIPMLFLAWLANSLASTISGMPSPSVSTAAQLIMRERPPAMTWRSQVGILEPDQFGHAAGEARSGRACRRD